MSESDVPVTDDTKPVHDRPTLISYASMSTWSWFIYAFGASLALLRDDQGTSTTIGGLHGTALAIGGVIGAAFAPALSNRIGRGNLLRVASLGAAVSILLYILPGMQVAGTLILAFIACFFGNLIVVGVNSFIGVHQGKATASALTESTAVAALMGLLGPLAVGFATTTVLGWRGGVAVAVISFFVIEIIRGRRTNEYGVAGSAATRKTHGKLPGLTYWAVMAATCYMGTEFCMSLWGADLLREQAGMSAGAAAAGLAALTGGIFIGRVFGSRLAQRVDSETLLRISLFASLVTFMFTWLTTSPAVVLSFLFLTGASFSLIWPLSMARILRTAPGLTDRASGTTLAFGTGAVAIAPFILGALASSLSIHTAFVVVPILLAIQTILVFFKPVTAKTLSQS
jgi:predicted MFS family arabinose efflux permease